MTDAPISQTPASRRAFAAAVSDERLLHWLESGLTGVGDIIPAPEMELNAFLHLVDTTGSAIVFVEINARNAQRAATLIEGVITAKPMLAIVAVGETMDEELLLAAMRAGARDYLTLTHRHSELSALIPRIEKRLPPPPTQSELGDVIGIYNTRPDGDTALLATQLALALQRRRPNQSVLLLDLGIPPGDAVTMAGLESSFSFIDAARNLRRLDATLIDNVCAHHDSGMRLLAMPDDTNLLSDLSSAEVYLLLGALRSHFNRLVVNLGGLPESDFLKLILGSTSQLLWLVDQRVPVCAHNLKGLRALRDAGNVPERTSLVVDGYQSRTIPDSKTLAESFELPLESTMPLSPQLRLRAVNGGRPIFDLAPRDPYARAVWHMAHRLDDIMSGSRNESGLFRRVKSAFGMQE